MKKILSAAFLAVSLLVVSCSGSAPELLDFIDENQGSVNYDGVKIVISSGRNIRNQKETAWSSLLGYDTNTNYGEAVRSRVGEIEKNLGVTIEFHNDESGVDSVKLKMMAGTYFADIVNYTEFGGMQNFAAGGLLYPITSFDKIDLSETWKYGAANVIEGGMVNSVPYSVQPVAWPNCEAVGITSLVYNMDMVNEFAAVDPHEFWENENWYWDTFEDTYLKGITISEEDEYVLSSSEKLFYYAFAYSNDLQWVSSNSDGEYVINTKPQALLEALSEAGSWWSDYGNVNLELFSDFWTHEAYDDGRAMFVISGPKLAGTSEIESGLMPFPCGPSCEYGTWPQAFDRINGFGIPLSSKEPDVAAHVISELFEPLDEYIGSLEDYYKDMIFNSEVDADIYISLISDAKYDYTFDGGADLMRAVNNNYSKGIKSGKSAVEIAETYSTSVEAVIQKHILPNYDYMYKNYYSK